MIGNFLSGAKTRLLPVSIPFRFFTAAVFFYGLFWAALLWQAGDITSYRLGSGPVLALIHLATLGVLTMTVIGASLQLLSVATRKPFKGVWMCRLLSWMYIPGFLLLVYAMSAGWYMGMLSGAILAGLGLLLFFYLIMDNIRGVRGMVAIMAHCQAAMLSLLGLVALGILLIVNLEYGLFADHEALASSHFIVAVFGFMSLLAMGFSYILVPMFALAPSPAEKLGRWSVGCNVAAVIVALVGINTRHDAVIMAGLAVGMVGAGLYLYSMIKIYRARMRKRLGTPFLLIRIAWIMLGVTLIWGAVGSAGYWAEYWPDSGYALFAVLAIVGWLLTFLAGILQRIIPFLSSMHSTGSGGVPMLVSQMADARLLDIAAAGHLGGLFFVALGIMLDRDIVIRLGAGAGFAGAVALFGYLIIILWQLWRKKSEKTAL